MAPRYARGTSADCGCGDRSAQGLTAIDIIWNRNRSGYTGTVHALSRRGLRGRRHQVSLCLLS